MATIEVKDLTKRFGDLVAVNQVNMQVAAGEVLCLLGPSGCGKTTTLRMIAGLESVTQGDVFLGGDRVNELSARERNVAMAFQFYALYPSLTVAQNLAYPLHADGFRSREIKDRVNSTAKTLELTDVLDRLPTQLAEGEKQRVAVGRAIIRDPNCFLFDEPLSRLDVELRHTMRGQIKRVLSGLSKATVIVTHDQLEALTMADRIAVMRDGLIEQIASPHDIFAQPANEFVAGFIGTPQMNLLKAAVVERTDDRVHVHVDGQPLTLRVAQDRDVGEEVMLGIRPRAFAIEPSIESSGAGIANATNTHAPALTLTADLIEPMGAETLIHAKSDTLDWRVVVSRQHRVTSGDRLAFSVNTEQVHMFDNNGHRIDRGRLSSTR